MKLRIPCHIYVQKLFAELVEIVKHDVCDCIALSGGIDTTAVLLAAVSAGVKPRGYVAVYREGLPKDLAYVVHLSSVLNIYVEYLFIDRSSLSSVVEKVVQCIGRENLDSHRDGGCIELRNDVVFYTVLSRAKEDGCRCIYTGTGGDEFFAGYGFMLRLTEVELDKAIETYTYQGRFPELSIARCVGVKVVAPFIHSSVVELARKIPVECLRSEKMMGKEVLREMIVERGFYGIGYRAKTPAEEGAGTKAFCRSMYDET